MYRIDEKGEQRRKLLENVERRKQMSLSCVDCGILEATYSSIFRAFDLFIDILCASIASKESAFFKGTH